MHLEISSAKWQPFCPAGVDIILRHTDPLSYDCPDAWEGTLQSMGKYITWIYRLACFWILLCFVYDRRKWCTTSYLIPDSKVMWPTWGPPWSCRPQVGPTLAPWTLLSGIWSETSVRLHKCRRANPTKHGEIYHMDLPRMITTTIYICNHI